MSETLLQIIPAEGWEAVWVEDPEDLYTARLVGWALVERVQGWSDASRRKVVGLWVSDETEAVELVGEDDPYFLGYQHVSDRDPDKWKARAVEAWREANRRAQGATDGR